MEGVICSIYCKCVVNKTEFSLKYPFIFVVDLYGYKFPSADFQSKIHECEYAKFMLSGTFQNLMLWFTQKMEFQS